MTNQVVIQGRLGRDPEVRAAGGSKVANFSVAVDDSYKDKNGTKQQKTHWVRVNAWGVSADIAGELRKGDECVVVGSLEVRSWEDKDKQKRETMEVKAFRVIRCAVREKKNEPKDSVELNDSVHF